MIPLVVIWSLFSLAATRPSDYTHSRCQYNGQFLPNTYDECSYFRCDYGPEPWYDAYGKMKFVEVKMKCPYGTSTNRYHFDPYNPCGATSYKCSAPRAPKYYTPPTYPQPPPHSYSAPHLVYPPPPPPHQPHNPYPPPPPPPPPQPHPQPYPPHQPYPHQPHTYHHSAYHPVTYQPLPYHK